MAKQNQKQRPIDRNISQATQSLSSRFVLASKTEIKAWKAFVIIVFAAGFFAALAWSAMNGWYVGIRAKNDYKLKNLIYAPYGTKADHAYGDLTDSLMKEVANSPYDSFAIEFSGVHDNDKPSFGSFSKNLSAVKKSGKFVWPRIYFNRVVGCCEAPACVQRLKDQNKCGDSAALAACYKENSPSTGYMCTDNGYYCRNACSKGHSLPAYFKNIAEKGKFIDLWDRAGALGDFFDLLETSLKLAKESGAPGIFIDHEIYHNYRMYRIDKIASANGTTSEATISKLEAIGGEIADKVNSIYPEAVLLFTSADFNVMQSDGKMRSTNYITEGILKRAKAKNYKLKVVEGGENSIWYLHSALDAPGVQGTMGPAGLKQSLDAQESDMAKYLRDYPKNFVLGGTHGLYLDWKDTKGNWNDWASDLNGKGQLKVKKIADFGPLLDYLFSKREYVWVFSGSPSSKGYDEFGFSKDSGYISQFRNILQPLFCGNDACDKNRGETCSICASDCGACSTPVPTPGSEPKSCGNGKCQEEKGETCANCPGDCLSICPISTPLPEKNSCPDGQCKGNETCSNCSEDCGVCKSDDSYAPSAVISGKSRLLSDEEPYYTRSKEVSFKGKTPDIGDGKVRIFENGKTLKIIKAKSSGAWRGTVKTQKKRTYNLQFKFYDRSGKEIHASDTFHVVKK